MKVKINLKLLEEQIALCDLFAGIDRKDGDKFEGIANLLSEIRFLAEMGETVHLEACEEE